MARSRSRPSRRLFELKGHDDIVAVAPEVLKANPQVKFVWIGDGILRDRLVADLERRASAMPLFSRAWSRRTRSPSCSMGSTR